MRKVVLIAVAIALVGGAAAYYFFGRGETKVSYSTERIRRGGMTDVVSSSGVVNPVGTVLVGTQVSGTILRIHADFNSMVRKGQVIAEIDPAIFLSRREQARADLAQAEAQVRKAEADREQALRLLERMRNLRATDSVSQSSLDDAETKALGADADVSVARARVAQARATLDHEETNLAYARILSPVDGVVVSRNVDVGQTVAASFQTPTLFTIAEDLTRMQIEASVDEADIGKVRAGQDATFTVDAYPESTFRGTVEQVRLAPTTVENVVTYNVIVRVANEELLLKPGMTATVAIVAERKEGVLMAPGAALRFVNPTDGGARYDTPGLWVLRAGAPVRVAVATGIAEGEWMEIAKGEVAEGEEVIVGVGGGRNQEKKGRRGFL
jgi:HlyD family secretion protein